MVQCTTSESVHNSSVICLHPTVCVSLEIAGESTRRPGSETRGRSVAEVRHRAPQSAAAADTLLGAVAAGLHRRRVPRDDEDAAGSGSERRRRGGLADRKATCSAEDVGERLGRGRGRIVDVVNVYGFER